MYSLGYAQQLLPVIIGVNPDVIDIPSPFVDFLLKEDSGFLLQEDGSRLTI